MKKYLLVSFLVLLPAFVAAQEIPVDVADADEVTQALVSSHFWIAVFAGFVLAIAFQLLLGGLLWAVGLSTFSIRPPGRKERRGQPMPSEGKEEHSAHATVRKVTAGVGLSWLITATLSAFFAAWLAVELAVVSSVLIGAILGLTIWGLFFIVLALFEGFIGMSLFGAASATVTGSVKMLYEGTKGLFGKSPAEQAGDIAERITQEVRDEIMGGVDTDDIRDTIEHYVHELSGPSPKEIRQELEKVLDRTELQTLIEEGVNQDEITTKLGIGENFQEKQRAQTTFNRIRDVISEMRSESDGGSRPERVSDAMLQMFGMSRRDAENAREKVADFLRSTDKEALNPEGIRRDLNRMFESPSQGAAALGARLSAIDKNTIADIMAQRTDMTRDEAHQRVDQIYGVFSDYTSEFRRSTMGQTQTQTRTGVSEAVKNRLPDMSDTRESAKQKVTDTVRNYLNRLDQPELNYEGIRRDMNRLFHDPRAGADALYNRMQRMDRDSVKAILASIKGIDDRDADKIVDNVMHARDETMKKAEQWRDEAERRLELARDEAYEQADELRKDARTVAMWSFINATVAGIAAAIGGMLAAGL